AVPIAAERLDDLLRQRGWLRATSDSGAVTTRGKLLVNAAFLLIMAVFVAARFYNVVRDQAGAEAKSYPVGATEYMVQHTLPAPIFNYYDWGGYFIAKLYPRYRVFIDGRTDLYGSLMDTFGA